MTCLLPLELCHPPPEVTVSPTVTSLASHTALDHTVEGSGTLGRGHVGNWKYVTSPGAKPHQQSKPLEDDYPRPSSALEARGQVIKVPITSGSSASFYRLENRGPERTVPLPRLQSK